MAPRVDSPPCACRPLADGAVVNALTGLSADAGFSFSRVKTWSGGCGEVYVYSLRNRGLFSAVAVPLAFPPAVQEFVP